MNSSVNSPGSLATGGGATGGGGSGRGFGARGGHCCRRRNRGWGLLGRRRRGCSGRFGQRLRFSDWRGSRWCLHRPRKCRGGSTSRLAFTGGAVGTGVLGPVKPVPPKNLSKSMGVLSGGNGSAVATNAAAAARSRDRLRAPMRFRRRFFARPARVAPSGSVGRYQIRNIVHVAEICHLLALEGQRFHERLEA